MKPLWLILGVICALVATIPILVIHFLLLLLALVGNLVSAAGHGIIYVAGAGIDNLTSPIFEAAKKLRRAS